MGNRPQSEPEESYPAARKEKPYSWERDERKKQLVCRKILHWGASSRLEAAYNIKPCEPRNRLSNDKP
jgi:hypothetical protein